MGHQCSQTPGRPILHCRLILSQTSAGSFLTLSPAAGRDIVSSLKRALEGCPQGLQQRPVLLTQPDVRRFVRKLIESELPGARVVTFSELLPETTIRAAGTATLRGSLEP